MDETELNRKKALENMRKNQGKVPGPITKVDVARVVGMPEDMIIDLFGEEAANSEDNMTGEREEESEGYQEEADENK